MPTLGIDIETYSEVDLPNAGIRLRGTSKL